MTEVEMEALALRVKELEAWREVQDKKAGTTTKVESKPLEAHITPAATKAEADKAAAAKAKEEADEDDKNWKSKK